MAQIPQYEDHVTAQGGIGGQASPSDFGAGIGQGMERVAGGLAQGADAVDAVDQNNGRIWAYNAASQAYTGLSKSFNDQVNALDPNDPEFSQKVSGLSDAFHSQIQQASDDAMASAPTKSARKIVASHMAMNGHALMQRAMGEQARLTGVYVSKMVEDTAKANQDSLAADPSNDNFDRIQAGMQETIGGLSVDPSLKMKWQANSEHAMAITQVGVLAATDPQGFLKNVHAQGGTTAGKGAVPGGVSTDTPAVPPPAPGGPVAPPSVEQVFDQIVQHESRGLQTNPETGEPLTNPKSGATGVSQILPKYGPYAAQLAGLPWDETKFKTDANYNHALGLAMFKSNLSTFGGDVAKAVAAYNVGPTGLRGYMSQAAAAGTPNDWLKFTPAETQEYVPSVMSKVGTLSQGQGQAPVAPAASALSVGDEQGVNPQVVPLTDQQIGQAAPAISGWGKLTWPEKVAVVRQAEAAMGANLASDRGKMDVALRDMSATYLAGKGYPNPPDVSLPNLQRLYGVDGGQRKFDDLAKVRDVGGAFSQLATMTDAQMQSTVNRLDVPGGPGFADQNPVVQSFSKATGAIMAARNADWPQFAIDNGIGSAKPIDFSTAQNFQVGILNRLPLATSGRTEYGAPAAHLLTKDEASGLGDLLNRMNPQDQMSYVKGLSTALANHPGWPADVWHQVAPKNAMLPIAAGISANRGTVSTAAGAQTGDIVGQYVLEGNHILMGGAPDGDGTKTGRAMNLDDKTFHTMFTQAVGPNAFTSPDAQRSAQVADDTYQAVKSYLAADIYKRGIDPKALAPTDVENAITAVTGGTMQTHGGTLFLPWGMDKRTFSQKFSVASSAAMDRAGLTGSAMDTPDAFNYSNWGEGKYLITMGGRALQGMDGRPVMVDINNLAPGVKTRPSVQLLK